MKHLSPDELSAFADGLAPDAEAAAHLRACGECRTELKELKALVQDLGVLPQVPSGLRQATLERIGLKPKRAKILNAWIWGPVLAAGLAFALVLPLVGPRTPLPVAPAAVPERLASIPVQGSPSKAEAMSLARVSPASPAKAQSEIASLPTPQPAPSNVGEHLSSNHAAAAPLALGAAAEAVPQTRSAMSVGTVMEIKATPTVVTNTLVLEAVRNNLIKPDKGENLSFDLSLPQSEALSVTVIDNRGRTVATLMDAPAGPGRVTLAWDGSVASGAYTVLARGEANFVSFKVLVVR